MKILFVSDDGLPDIRVEREILTLVNQGREVHFIGPFKYTTLIDKELIKSVHDIKISAKAKLKIEPYYYWTRRKISKIIKSIKPDVIIGVNFFSTMLIYGLGYPIIFDDHDFNPLLIAFRYITKEYKGYVQNIIALRALSLMIKYGYKIVSEHITWTISEYIRRIYSIVTGSNNIYVLRNYPSEIELRSTPFIKLDKPPLKLCFFGSKLMRTYTSLIRRLKEPFLILNSLREKGINMTISLYGVLNKEIEGISLIEYKGYIPRTIDLLKQIAYTHACFLAWLPTPIQAYYSPNKLYQCMASGSIPLVVNNMTEVIEEVGKGIITVNSIDFEHSLERVLLELYSMETEELNRKRYQSYITIRKKPWEIYKHIINESIKKA